MLKRLQCVLFLILLSAASLVAQTHVAEPAVNLGDTSFLDGHRRTWRGHGSDWRRRPCGNGRRREWKTDFRNWRRE